MPHAPPLKPPVSRVRLDALHRALQGALPERNRVQLELFRQVRGAAYRLRQQILRDGGRFDFEVEGLCLDVLYSLLELLERQHFADDAHLDRTVRISVRRRLLNLVRLKNGPLRLLSFQEDDGSDPLQQAPSTGSSPEALVAAALDYERLRAAIERRCTAEEWEIWRLATEEELISKEIGQRLGRSPVFVRVTLHKLRQGKLKALLLRWAQGGISDDT